jgi:hypothetical protein
MCHGPELIRTDSWVMRHGPELIRTDSGILCMCCSLIYLYRPLSKKVLTPK